MSILIDENTRVIIQGISGTYGRRQTKMMVEYGTQVVAGIGPGRSGQVIEGVPVYDTVKEAAQHHPFDASVIYVPPSSVKGAAIEAMEGGARLLLIAAEGVPIHDTMLIKRMAKEKDVWITGPNTLGMISPGKCLVGSLAPSYALKGNVGLITRGGTIAIELIRMMSEEGIGQSTCIGSGGDKVIGKNPKEYLELFNQDPETKVILLAGEIGGIKENECAELIRSMDKPVIVYITGRTAPKGARMGHIGAIISRGEEGFFEKRKILEDAGAFIANTPWEAIRELKRVLGSA